MYAVNLTLPLETKEFGLIPAGETLWHDQNAFEIGLIAPRGTVSVEKASLPSGPIGGGNTRTLIVRSGAWGDLLLLSPILRELANSSVTIACAPQHFPLFEGLAINTIPYPVPAELPGFASAFDLGNVVETNRDLHVTDAFAKALGVEAVTDYRPHYVVRHDETEWAHATYPRSERPRLAVQLVSSSRYKNWPLPSWLRLMVLLESRGWEIMVLGAKDEIPPLKPTVRAVRMCYTKGHSFRESAAILSTCDAFCGPDSALLHLCHALDIPASGLYAAHPWKNYTSKAPKTRVLTGVGECAPCGWYPNLGRAFPAGKPCSQAGYCVPLAEIRPERVAAKIEQLRPARR